MKIHRGRIAQYRHDQLLREYLTQNLTEIIRQKELIIDGKVKTQIATLDLPTLKFGEESQFLAQGAGSGGGAGGGTDQIQGLGGLVGGDYHGKELHVELDFDEFVKLAQEALLEEPRLPTFHEPARPGEVESQDLPELDDLDRIGLHSDLNLEETMVQSLLRNARERSVLDYDVDVQQDAWYLIEDPATLQNTRSVEIYVLDISGSMRGNTSPSSARRFSSSGTTSSTDTPRTSAGTSCFRTWRRRNPATNSSAWSPAAGRTSAAGSRRRRNCSRA